MPEDTLAFFIMQQKLYEKIIGSAVTSVIIPIALIFIGHLITQYFLNRKSFKDLVENTRNQVANKVSYEKFDTSITRIHSRVDAEVSGLDQNIKKAEEKSEKGDNILHSRMNEHIDKQNEHALKISETLSNIKESVAKIAGSVKT